MDVEPDAPEYLNVRQTAKALGVHENTVRNWVRSGVLVSARLPGTNAHRFARTEVDRLNRERGTPTSSVGPALRVDEPELISATELDRWAATGDAKGAFPELMRRLLVLTPGISNIQIRTHEGTAAPGWDGTADSSGSSFLPAGKLLFEFGTNANPKAKADSDYAKRRGATTDTDAVFVFATPRNWAGASSWAANRATEGLFHDVKALDGHGLEGWLQATPPVHYWISERLGYLPRDVQTIERWSDAFSARLRLSLPDGVFLAGRIGEAERLVSLLTGASSDRPIYVEASWHQEAIRFIAAALRGEPALLGSVLVVGDAQAWQRLTLDASRSSILIPDFGPEIDLATAIRNGHRVILPAGLGDVRRDHEVTLRLPKLDRVGAAEALRTSHPDLNNADSLVALGRRSMPALVRRLARDSRLLHPAWSLDPNLSVALAPLVLVGTWANAAGDQAVVEQLAGRPYQEVDRMLVSLARSADAPFTRSGGHWRLVDPVEAAFLLLPQLTENDLGRWAEVAHKVLLAEDPFRGMDAVARMTAQVQGVAAEYSDIVRGGIADSLALVGANASDLPRDLRMRARVDRIVGRALDAAAEDASGNGWEAISKALPSLAEASPERFLDAVSEDLNSDAPTIASMFRDQTDSMFGPSSPHPSLLWALESLGWSPDYFGQATELLARLAELDPGGRLSNRPIESLQNLLQGWVAQSGARSEEKLAAVERIVNHHPAVGWKLLVGLWPDRHGVAFPPQSPSYRDWTPASNAVTWADWGAFVDQLSELAVQAAGTDAVRWLDLIPVIDNLPDTQRRRVLERLIHLTRTQPWSRDDRFRLWEAITSEASQHEKYADADWSMPAAHVALLRDAARNLEVDDDSRRYARLFDWRASVNGLKVGEPGYHEQLAQAQREALEAVMAQGPAQLEALTRQTKTPFSVGSLLARLDANEDQILGWLESEEPGLQQAVAAYVSARLDGGGIEWLEAVLNNPALASADARERVIGLVPISPVFWTRVPELDPSLEDAYWRRGQFIQVAVEDRPSAVSLLLEHEQPWAAVGLLSDMLHDGQMPSVESVKAALDGVRGFGGSIPDPTMAGYNIARLLSFLEEEAPEDSELPAFEFLFFDLLDDHQPTDALYRLLARDPEDFVTFVRAMFRSEGETKRKLSAQEKAFGQRAFSVLREWSRIPGTRDDGTIDSVALGDWVRSARLSLADSGHGSIGDEQIGQVLACSPAGADGVWPAEAVRDLIETVGSARIDTGVQIGRANRRGISSRGVFDGGNQERSLEASYRDMAARLSTRWPRTARILRGLADSYMHEALQHDADAERWGDDG